MTKTTALNTVAIIAMIFSAFASAAAAYYMTLQDGNYIVVAFMVLCGFIQFTTAVVVSIAVALVRGSGRDL